jgi:quercetin dioxygenase-like cupin family protein
MRMFKLTRVAITLSLMVAVPGLANAQPPHDSNHSASEATLNRPGCVPIAQRGGREAGCYILVSEGLSQLQGPIFWSLYNFPSWAAAEKLKQPGETIFESLGKIWLSHIGNSGAEMTGGERVAEIGPLPVKPGINYQAVYMEAVFTPGMRASVHRHSGPEAWHTVAGETCLETPEKTYLGRAGGPPVIVPEGPPMALTATGTEIRKAVVLILHDASKPHTTLTSDWTPKGECQKHLKR